MIYLLIYTVVVFLACVYMTYDERKRIGYIKGDSIGMIIASMVPILNFLIGFAIVYAFSEEYLSGDKKYFQAKK